MPEREAPAVGQGQKAAPVEVCASGALAEGGVGVRFRVSSRHAHRHAPLSGFVIRFRGTVYGYLNQCAHVPSELDWEEGRFFDHSGLYLMCATHGALYEPESGRCAGGPCRGARLKVLSVIEQDGVVYWQPDDAFYPPPPLRS